MDEYQKFMQLMALQDPESMQGLRALSGELETSGPNPTPEAKQRFNELAKVLYQIRKTNAQGGTQGINFDPAEYRWGVPFREDSTDVGWWDGPRGQETIDLRKNLFGEPAEQTWKVDAQDPRSPSADEPIAMNPQMLREILRELG